MPKIWTLRLDPGARAVHVPVVITGPTGRSAKAEFVLDTGTPVTIVGERLAALLDLGKDRSEGDSKLWGPTGPDLGYRVRTASLTLMGETFTDRQVRAHHLWADAGVDGLIGLDIIRMGRLTLDLPWGVFEFR